MHPRSDEWQHVGRTPKWQHVLTCPETKLAENGHCSGNRVPNHLFPISRTNQLAGIVIAFMICQTSLVPMHLEEQDHRSFNACCALCKSVGTCHEHVMTLRGI